ncbi:MAG: thiamine-phosphate kinase, partial [Yaniella sp.]|nr:thiamine-phosphate kinase [Yaniella sp.]
GWAEVQAAQLRPVADRYAVDPRDWVLTGGEDYGLLAVQRPDLKVPPGWHVIGKLSRKPQDRPTVTGWDHF